MEDDVYLLFDVKGLIGFKLCKHIGKDRRSKESTLQQPQQPLLIEIYGQILVTVKLNCDGCAHQRQANLTV